MDAEKFDITQIYPQLYNASQKEVLLIEVPFLRILAISGQGNTAGPRFGQSIEALSVVAGEIKHLPELGIEPDGFMDYVMSPLECLWAMKNGEAFDVSRKDQWLWELFLVVPGFMTQGIVTRIIAQLDDQKPNPYYEQLHVATLEEKQAVQTLHIGSYENETEDIGRMHKLMQKHGLKPSGRFHEIYLNDPKTVRTASLRTILRQPVVPAKGYK
jgi:hypothetical protein